MSPKLRARGKAKKPLALDLDLDSDESPEKPPQPKRRKGLATAAASSRRVDRKKATKSSSRHTKFIDLDDDIIDDFTPTPAKCKQDSSSLRTEGIGVETPLRQGKSSAQYIDPAIQQLMTGTEQSTAEQESEQMEWTDAYRPDSTRDVVINRRKVQEITGWVHHSRMAIANGQKQFPRILALKGPPGSGKTTTVRAVVKDLGLSINEFRDTARGAAGYYQPPSEIGGSEEYVSTLQAFRDFIKRAASFAPLLNIESGQTPSNRMDQSSQINRSRNNQLVLVEEIPHNPRSGSQVEEFHDSLRIYHRRARFPLIFCVTTGPESSTRLGVSKLFDELEHQGLVATISMREVAPTFVVKALQRIVDKERLAVPKSYLVEVAEACNGDLRAALRMLKMSSLGHKGETRNTGRKKTKVNATNGKQKITSATDAAGKEEERSKTDFFGKDHILHMFHALGRVLHAKRDENGRLLHEPEDVAVLNGIAGPTFLAFISENYAAYLPSLEGAAAVADGLSLADMLHERWDLREHLNEAALAIATRTYANEQQTKVGGKWRPLRRPVWMSDRDRTEGNNRFLLRMQTDLVLKHGRHGTRTSFLAEEAPLICLIHEHNRDPTAQLPWAQMQGLKAATRFRDNHFAQGRFLKEFDTHGDEELVDDGLNQGSLISVGVNQGAPVTTTAGNAVVAVVKEEKDIKSISTAARENEVEEEIEEIFSDEGGW